ncbi:unnamed protein product [Spirodela intermedia]|uniref:Uncharacterized protein n=1 Tax=Spirodela intermedia TaxID=51605 RepID=A0A7I8K701_SPIIN|nr:unnamed protein product [Spirodela intermedia]CAA7392781.1 unnamed protein product [Spirodela intermedia]
MDFLFAYLLHIILKTLVFSKPLARISHQKDEHSNICPTFKYLKEFYSWPLIPWCLRGGAVVVVNRQRNSRRGAAVSAETELGGEVVRAV